MIFYQILIRLGFVLGIVLYKCTIHERALYALAPVQKSVQGGRGLRIPTLLYVVLTFAHNSKINNLIIWPLSVSSPKIDMLYKFRLSIVIKVPFASIVNPINALPQTLHNKNSNNRIIIDVFAIFTRYITSVRAYSCVYVLFLTIRVDGKSNFFWNKPIKRRALTRRRDER